ncbi:MAG: DUF2855 family protein [Mangrovicoccus sp.]|nr:DUF2855 family protein [Mangrovicoccus sp.]
MQQIHVDQQHIPKTTLRAVPAAALAPGDVRLKLQSFALTANNVTYAAAGFTLGYWQFFPTGVEGQGQAPVWGVASVSESHSDLLQEGTRLYGFFPMAEEFVITPKAPDAQSRVLTDGAAHRAKLPPVYNNYVRLGASTPAQDHLRCLLQPLLATSWLLYDWLEDNAYFGAEQVVVVSASSKTGLGLCKFLAEAEDAKIQRIGLTSANNRDFVAQNADCDAVLTYDEIESLPQRPTVIVDMAGNAAMTQALHAHLGDNIRHDAAVGTSHWDKFAKLTDLAGTSPQFFSAPAQIAKRWSDWGPGVAEEKISAAWKRIVAEAESWLDVQVHHGLDQAPSIWADLAAGKANPKHGHIIRP